MQRTGSRNRYYVRRIPSDVKAESVGLKLALPVGEQTQLVSVTRNMQAVRLSLRTNDPAEVKRRQAAIDAFLETVWSGLRDEGLTTLTHKQATALAGDLYRAWASGEGRENATAIEQDPDVQYPDDHIYRQTPNGKREPSGWRRTSAQPDPDEWSALLAYWSELRPERGDEESLEPVLGPIVDRLLLSRGIRRVVQPSRQLLLYAFWLALKDAFEHRQRNAAGDYSADARADRFPEWQPTNAKATARVSLTGLVEEWWREAKSVGRKPATYESYKRTVAYLSAYLEHDDATQVMTDDVVAFKNHRLATINPRNGRPISPNTVKDTDLAGLKSVFDWAVANGKLQRNPAKGVTIKLGRRKKVRRGFDDNEALSVLRAALALQKGGERLETFAAKRWVPWLLAYSGARVGEMAQLRKEDIVRDGKSWIATISPEAGTVKSDEVRTVVLHPHLVELGFIEFVKQARPGHLFLRPAKSGDVLGPLQGVKNRLAEFVRALVPDKAVDPNHGWRHRFKTICRMVGIEAEIRDYIQGHAPRSEGERYGQMPTKPVAAAISKLPRYKISGAK